MGKQKQDPQIEWGFHAVIPRLIRTNYEKLTPVQKWLYVCLKDLCGEHGTCYRALRVLAEETGISIGMLSESIRCLHDAGLIHAEKKRRSNNPTAKEVWHITIVDIWQANAKVHPTKRSQNEHYKEENVHTVNIIVHTMNDTGEKRSPGEQKRSHSETEEESLSSIIIEEESSEAGDMSLSSESDAHAPVISFQERKERKTDPAIPAMPKDMKLSHSQERLQEATIGASNAESSRRGHPMHVHPGDVSDWNGSDRDNSPHSSQGQVALQIGASNDTHSHGSDLLSGRSTGPTSGRDAGGGQANRSYAPDSDNDARAAQSQGTLEQTPGESQVIPTSGRADPGSAVSSPPRRSSSLAATESGASQVSVIPKRPRYKAPVAEKAQLTLEGASVKSWYEEIRGVRVRMIDKNIKDCNALAECDGITLDSLKATIEDLDKLKWVVEHDYAIDLHALAGDGHLNFENNWPRVKRKLGIAAKQEERDEDYSDFDRYVGNGKEERAALLREAEERLRNGTLAM